MDMKQVNPPLAFLYSILYISFMTVIIVNLFIAILNSSLKAIKDNQESVSDKLDLADFIVGFAISPMALSIFFAENNINSLRFTVKT